MTNAINKVELLSKLDDITLEINSLKMDISVARTFRVLKYFSSERFEKIRSALDEIESVISDNADDNWGN